MRKLLKLEEVFEDGREVGGGGKGWMELGRWREVGL